LSLLDEFDSSDGSGSVTFDSSRLEERFGLSDGGN